jgi:hypothetical protein
MGNCLMAALGLAALGFLIGGLPSAAGFALCVYAYFIFDELRHDVARWKRERGDFRSILGMRGWLIVDGIPKSSGSF